MIYLDNSATTKTKKEVLETFVQVSERYYGNPASLHRIGNEAEDLLEKARTQIKQSVNMEQVVFTSGGTESNTLALIGTAKAYQHRGKHIITAATEHASVLNNLKTLVKEGFEVTVLPVDSQGNLNLAELEKSLRHDTILVSLMHVNNETGAVHPIEEIRKILKGSRAFLHVDAVQSFGRIPLPKESMPDLLTISAHKIHGLKGSGLLAFNNLLPDAVQQGGGQEFGIRSGTVSVPHAAALARTVRLAEPNPDFARWNEELRIFFSDLPHVHIVSPKNAAPHILAVSVSSVRGEILVSALQKESVIVSTSSACSSKGKGTSHVIDAMGLPREYKEGVMRISFGAFTTDQEIKQLKKAFLKVYDLIKGV
ncbi:MAG TPA: cysteine desulfurase family protein [Planococcus sp. (in: firmicutes)]|nr:cysteine desulfurase family protein [Planococcus sp. (in: firmicutes)]